MGKFNRPGVRPAVHSPVTSTGRTLTARGGQGYLRDPRSELFLLAVANFVNEETFHEKASDRDRRFEELVRQVALEDYDWLVKMAAWLRGEAHMRSASIALAVHAVKARTESGLHERNGDLIDSVLQRPDEPGEFLAAWHALHGRNLPKAVRWGLEQAMRRLYTEAAVLKYDSAARAVRFADVLEIVHPDPVSSPGNDWQSDLFRYLLDQRHHGDGTITERLPMLKAHQQMRWYAERNPRLLCDPDKLAAAGMTWEDVLSLGGSKVDKKLLWESLIPRSMGTMAMIRNLRNFDEAGVSDKMAAVVAARISDPEQVKRSRQFPFRYLTAYRNAPSLRWAYPLEQALNHSLASVPQLPGRTLILVDTSSSMSASFSKDGSVMRWDAAALFGIALGLRCAKADVVSFSGNRMYWDRASGVSTRAFPLQPRESLLKALDRWKNGGWFLGGGTDTALALREEFSGHDRVVIVTDEQADRDDREVTESIPQKVPMYTWNLAGYRAGHAPSGSQFRHTFGGLTDAAFQMVSLLEMGVNARWPWQQ